jgi:hypothetical protein
VARIQYVPRVGQPDTFFYAQQGQVIVGTIWQNSGQWFAMPFRQPALPPCPNLAGAKLALRRALQG